MRQDNGDIGIQTKNTALHMISFFSTVKDESKELAVV